MRAPVQPLANATTQVPSHVRGAISAPIPPCAAHFVRTIRSAKRRTTVILMPPANQSATMGSRAGKPNSAIATTAPTASVAEVVPAAQTPATAMMTMSAPQTHAHPAQISVATPITQIYASQGVAKDSPIQTNYRATAVRASRVERNKTVPVPTHAKFMAAPRTAVR